MTSPLDEYISRSESVAEASRLFANVHAFRQGKDLPFPELRKETDKAILRSTITLIVRHLVTVTVAVLSGLGAAVLLPAGGLWSWAGLPIVIVVAAALSGLAVMVHSMISVALTERSARGTEAGSGDLRGSAALATDERQQPVTAPRDVPRHRNTARAKRP